MRERERERERGILSSVRRFKILAFLKHLHVGRNQATLQIQVFADLVPLKLLVREGAVVTISESRKDGVIVFIYTFYRYYVSYYGNSCTHIFEGSGFFSLK